MLILIWVFNAVALLVVSYIVPGFVITSFWSALAAALILGLVNILVRPILLLISLPVTIITLGLFSFVVNALMLELVASVVKGFDISGFRVALLAAIVLAIINWASDYFLHSIPKQLS